MTLSEKQFDLINFIEQEYLLHGAIPTAAKINQLGLATEKYYKDFMADKEVRNNLVARGISLRGSGNDSDRTQQDLSILTEEQLTAANTMLDLTDNRSRKKKLIDLGIPTQKWEAWLRDAAFQHYLRTRAESLLGDNLHTAHLALLDRVASGDTGAIKFYYEITGRYVPKGNDTVDVVSLLMRVLEIIQRHVSDDQQVMAIGEELLTLANGVSVGRGADVARVVDVKVLEGM